MNDPLAAVIASQMRHYRKSVHGWTVRQFADLCSPLIPGLTGSSVTNIERARRDVSTSELLVIAHVLRVPPAALLLPLADPRALVELVPGVELPIGPAMAWLTATAPEGLDVEEPASIEAPRPPRTGGGTVSDQPTRTVTETCRCGGSTTVTADTLDAAQAAVREWRTTHLCTTQVEADDARRTGAGGANLGFAAPPRAPWGHNTLDVRALHDDLAATDQGRTDRP
jgi:hypothetical protein